MVLGLSCCALLTLLRYLNRFSPSIFYPTIPHLCQWQQFSGFPVWSLIQRHQKAQERRWLWIIMIKVKDQEFIWICLSFFISGPSQSCLVCSNCKKCNYWWFAFRRFFVSFGPVYRHKQILCNLFFQWYFVFCWLLPLTRTAHPTQKRYNKIQYINK